MTTQMESPSRPTRLAHHFIYAGIDPSLTNTGVAIQAHETSPTCIRQVKSAGKTDDTWEARGQRIITLATQAARIIHHGTLVVIEAPSYGSRGGAQHDRAGLWWEIHHRLRANDCTVIAATPSQRMKYVTGKGRADKDQVLASAIRRYPHLDISNNNTADAVIFMAMAARLAGQPIERDTEIQAMDEVTEKLSTQLPEAP